MKNPLIIQTILDNIEINTLVNSFFKDPQKTLTWMNSENPLLGGLSPIEMILIGRTEKLKKFIKNQLEGNIG